MISKPENYSSKMTCSIVYGVDKIVLYERYIQNKRDQNDMAVVLLVHLDRTIQFRSDVKLICFASSFMCKKNVVLNMNSESGSNVEFFLYFYLSLNTLNSAKSVILLNLVLQMN